MNLRMRLLKPAAYSNFVDLVSRDPAFQIILVRFVSFCFNYMLFCSTLEQISVQSSLNLRFLVRIVRFKWALRSMDEYIGVV